MQIKERVVAAGWGCILVAVTCGFAGCRATVHGGFGAKNISWDHIDVGKTARPGIDRASVNIGAWGDGAAIVVWSDGAGGSFGGSRMGHAPLEPGETRGGAKYEGRLASKEGRVIHVRCYTPDGKTGTVRIGDESYELARGGLFLVSVSGAKPKVKQLELARLDLKPAGSRTLHEINLQTLEDLAMTDPEIRAFFAEAAKTE